MIRYTIFIFLLLGLFSCGQPSNDKKSETDQTKNSLFSNELWTIYAKQDSVFHVKRLLSSESGFYLLSYDINTSEAEVAKQTFISSRKFTNEKETIPIKSQNGNFNWIPFNTAPILFVQLQSSAFKDEMQALTTRQATEDKIGDALKAKGLGEWIAGDLGPGGGNMLFEVSNIDNAIAIILKELSKVGLDKKTIIARRINTEAENWFYEVIYPSNFTGVFLTM